MARLIRLITLILMAFLFVLISSILRSQNVHASDYTFYYKLKPGQTWVSKKTSILRFRSQLRNVEQFSKRMVEYKISDSATPGCVDISARVLEQVKDNRRIRTFEGVLFKGVLNSNGTLSYYSFSGGSPQYRAIIAAACPAMEYEIFWMPEFPSQPLKIGDHFKNNLKMKMAGAGGAGPGINAQVHWVYSLTNVKDHIAYFSAEDQSFMRSPSVEGRAEGQELSLFNIQEGMWTEFNIRIKGQAYGPGMRSGKHYQEVIKIEIEKR